ncbi:ATP-dependent protease [Caloranaerobacter azorensis H53214]|uniref:endopeptidase La n=1 Tax=Caloranaerobacter azorensis H53214 TaxID=1156417 RepID=A0A096DLU1_9FIRM|nr:ATP-binding protein [Caloranaerobacter azorensis]KGG80251.1 ATP-dependent protease [Caloranaerobacter azorensis H53214]
MRKDLVVPVEILKNSCDISIFQFETTEEIPPIKEIIGQKRATKALKFGLSVKKKGYNIFVTGITGTGRNSYSYSVAKDFAKRRSTPDDWCYVYNFKKPESPKAIRLKAGQGIAFKREVENVISKLRVDIPKVFSSREYEDKKNLIYHNYQKKVEEIIDELNIIAKDYGFVFKQNENGLISIPLVDGRPISEEELENISEDEINKIRENSSKLSAEAYDIFNKFRKLDEQLRDRLKQLNEKVTFDAVDFYLDQLIKKYKDNEEIEKFLNEMEDDIIKNLNQFLDREENSKLNEVIGKLSKHEDFFKRYEINLFIDNSNCQGAPVIREVNPNYYNLLGKIEYVNESGVLKTDHTRIKPGAIHEANGGYLIVQAKDILTNPFAWDGLKRALISREIKIENIIKGSVVAETLKPEPIPLDIKVIVIGDYYTYQLLYDYDDDFKKLFKIRADFDIEMERNEENIRKIASFIALHCKEENLRHFHKSAVGKVIEYCSRLAEDQRKLSARFNEIVELLYEADAWADAMGDSIVTAEHVVKAIEEKIYRNNKYEEKLQELFKDGILLIETSGWKVGEINGLAVMDSGQYSFGRPNKITVSTFVGKEGIINIEREVQKSGSIHDKGVLILSGYLGERYAREKPLSLTASITFEQSYEFIDGDSASSTELYALLSSLSDLPINQAIAVTGSVNQKGIVQPIGGVNEKIEGFYKVCKSKGFKGGEGVIIPYQNIRNLMLSDEVIQAVEEGKFTIYAVKTIEEGIEILTGVPAGEMDDKGRYPVGTVNYLVQKKLDKYANINREYD